MAVRARKPCNRPGCSELVSAGIKYCPNHQTTYDKARHKQYDANRPEWHDLYNDDRYRKARLRFLRQHPLCVHCEERGRLTPATRLDHIQDHKGDLVLFWDENNWQGLCESDHNRKTARTNPRLK